MFLADQFDDAARDDLDGHPGGAELTDAAAIEASPWPVERLRASDWSPGTLGDFDLHVVGTLENASDDLLEALCDHGRHVLFEHDVRICRWRGNFPAAGEPVHRHAQRCLCPHRRWRRLFETAMGTIFLTHRQMRVYLDNPWFAPSRTAVLGSSLMNEAFFERVEQARSRDRKRDIEAAILGSGQRIKGTEPARQCCREHGVEPFVIEELDPEEVLDVLERTETFVYLPRALEPAGRMLLESRFLGCEVIANAHTGVCGESWWHLDDEQALEVTRDAPRRFWRLIRRFIREKEAPTTSTPESDGWLARLVGSTARETPTLETDGETILSANS